MIDTFWKTNKYHFYVMKAVKLIFHLNLRNQKTNNSSNWRRYLFSTFETRYLKNCVNKIFIKLHFWGKILNHSKIITSASPISHYKTCITYMKYSSITGRFCPFFKYLFYASDGSSCWAEASNITRLSEIISDKYQSYWVNICRTLRFSPR